MTHTDLLRQALDALELQEPAVGCPREREHWRRTAMPTIAALRAALAQPETQPVNQQIESINAVFDAWRNGEDASMTLGLATPQAQPAPAVQVVLRQPNLFAADPAAPAVNCEWTNCPRRVGDVCCNDRPAAPAVREPLTAERLQKHAMFAADAPPASAVVLVSSLHRLLGITGDSAPAVQPLTDEQIDEIWDGTFDSADPKRQLSFRQIITRAIERAHGITGDSNG